jgi:vacuolar-type H+-ATPase subunit E/Vma4
MLFKVIKFVSATMDQIKDDGGFVVDVRANEKRGDYKKYNKSDYDCYGGSLLTYRERQVRVDLGGYG